MTFRTTLGEHLMMTSSANMFYIATDCKNTGNMKVAASNKSIKYISCFLNNGFLVSA